MSSPHVSEITSPTGFAIGDPVVVTRNDAVLIGRITAFDGDQYRGVYPIVEVFTPHGSGLTLGRCWLRLPTEGELVQLSEYEEISRNSADVDELYGGRLPSSTLETTSP